MRLTALLLGCCLACGNGDPKPVQPGGRRGDQVDPKPGPESGAETAAPSSDPAAVARTRELLPRLAEPEVMIEVVSLLAWEPLVEALGADGDAETARLACLALGGMGGAAARAALLGILQAPSPDPERDGPRRLYAAVGLTRMADPATAIALIEALSKVNPNDNVASLASEEGSAEYYTVDAQICEALLAMGLFTAEEDLVEQMRRRDRIRVLIDAYAVLRRTTGFDLPYYYNGSYEVRLRQAEAWRTKLRETRSQREAARVFDATNATFVRECGRVVGWLAGQSMNNRLIAHKVLDRVGRYALPQLEQALRSDRGVAQRQAAYMMGRIGHASAAPALRVALDSKDDDARAEAIDALRLVGDAQSVGIVSARLLDADPEVRAAAARYLGQFGGDAARARLGEALKAESRPAAKAALWIALLRLGDEAALAPVLAVFVGGEQIEREAAQAVLEEKSGRKLAADARASEDERSAAAEAFRIG